MEPNKLERYKNANKVSAIVFLISFVLLMYILFFSGDEAGMATFMYAIFLWPFAVVSAIFYFVTYLRIEKALVNEANPNNTKLNFVKIIRAAILGVVIFIILIFVLGLIENIFKVFFNSS